jgi:regulator of replication initiation timing
VSAVDRFNRVVDIAKKLGDVELKQALMEIRKDLQQLLAENQKLRVEVRKLREELYPEEKPHKPKGEVRFERGAYWLVEDDGQKRGPMCTGCWETRQHLHRLLRQMQDFFMCPECGTVMRLPGVEPS